MFTIAKSKLRAAIPVSAKKDVRYYLQGALIEVCTNGDMHIVGTDGSVMFCGLIPAPYVKWTDRPKSGPFRIIVPNDAIKAACKGKGDVALTAMPDGRYMLGDTVFTAIDGHFPDWRRVCKLVGDTDEVGQYDPDLLAKCKGALADWFNAGPKFVTCLHQRGTNAGILTGDDMTGFCVVMPWRIKDAAEVRPFTPATY